MNRHTHRVSKIEPAILLYLIQGSDALVPMHTKNVRRNPRGMKKKHLSLAGLIVLFLIASGCQPSGTLPAPTSSLTAAPTESTTQPAVTNPDNEVLYSEDFEDPSRLSGWDTKTQNESSAAVVENGAYHLRVDKGDVAAILRGQNFTDMIM